MSSDANRRIGCAQRRSKPAAPGQSTVELAMMLPVLVLMLLVGADFGRMFYMSIAVNNAARAGAQYGAQSLITAANASGIATAALTDGVNISSLTVPTATQCTCESGSNVTPCPANYCTNAPNATFVQVGTQAPFHTLATYPGIPSSLTLTGYAVMQVQQ